MSTFWKANKKTEKAIRRAASHWYDVIAPEAERLWVELGADAAMYQTGSGVWRFLGFRFQNNPDEKLFFKIKETEDFWQPRQGSPIHERMLKLKSNWVGEVKNILGISEQSKTMGVEILDSCVLIEWIYDEPPVGCRKISANTYQKLKGDES